jgi:hypothetical protein
MTVTTSRSPGRARRKPLKPLRAGMPGCSGGPVVTNSCAFYTSHTRLRVHRAPGIPRALIFGRRFHAQLGRIAPRDRGVVSCLGCLKIESVAVHRGRACRTLNCHHPRKRVIQYSETLAIDPKGRGVLDTLLAPGMTDPSATLTRVVIARSDLSAVAQRAKAEATKQSIFLCATKWIASRSLESITTIGSMDSGLAPRGAPRNDGW